MTRRRPHSWNGDEEELKKCAAIECLLSATDDDQWPVEKLVDELCARLKLLQLEQQNDGRGSGRRLTGLGSSAPECFDGPSSDSDSFTSVSSPEIEPENYYQAFPPLEYLSDCEEQVNFSGHYQDEITVDFIIELPPSNWLLHQLPDCGSTHSNLFSCFRQARQLTLKEMFCVVINVMF